jgi:CubicO group peptidase (beta-lactamase class C family)
MKGCSGIDAPLQLRARLATLMLLASFPLYAQVPALAPAPADAVGSPSLRAQVTTGNWDKGGAISHWVYTHLSEVFPAAVVRRGGTIRELPLQPRPEIGALVVDDTDPAGTLDRFAGNGAVDGVIVLQHGVIVYEKHPRVAPDETHLVFSVTKALVATILAILEDQGKVDLSKPLETYIPELKRSAWAGTTLRDVSDMRSGMAGEENKEGDSYRNPARIAFQLEATLGWQLRTAPSLGPAIRRGDLIEFLSGMKRLDLPGAKWAYNSTNTALLAEVVSRVSGKSLADAASDLVWSRIGADHDALLAENSVGYPVAHAGLAATLRDVARFGLVFTKERTGGRDPVVSERVVQRMFQARGSKVDEHGMLPLTYQWDLIGEHGELAKGGWAGQLLYVNREKDVVVVWMGTNKTGDYNAQPLPCRMIARALP